MSGRESFGERAPANGAGDARRHVLKCWAPYFAAVKNGTKPFEVRRDDRDPPFSVGDTLVLREYDPTRELPTGRMCERTVTYVMEGGQFGLHTGYVVMGLANVVSAPRSGANRKDAQP